MLLVWLACGRTRARHADAGSVSCFHPTPSRSRPGVGLRGGISAVLALSLPLGPERQIVLALTYIVVLFSILGAGPTVGRLIKVTVAPPAPAR